MASFFRYLRKARHYKGYGIHSPFVFYVVRELFFEAHTYDAFSKIDSARNMLLKNKQRVNVDTRGAASVKDTKVKRVKDLVNEGSIPPKYGRLMFRMINYFSARNILEMGTSLGAGTLFLSLPHSGAKVTTIEGNRELCSLARGLFDMVEVENVDVVNGSFHEVLPEVLANYEQLDFVFFDGDHRLESTLQYFEMCLEKFHNDTVFVFDDIHWSRDMEKAWHTIISHPKVTVSLDLYRIGIVFFRKECTKQHYVVWY